MKSLSLLALASIVVGLAGCTKSVAPIAETTGTQSAPPAYDPTLSTRMIAFHEERVKNDPQGAIGWAMLGEAYLESAREHDDIALAEKAENAALTSLKVRKRHNDRAALLLANAHLEHHEFAEALDAIKLALSLNVGNSMAVRMEADVLMELGRYKEARGAVDMIRDQTDNPSTLVTVARFEELTGNTEKAIADLKAAVAQVDKNTGVAAPTAAYFHNRLGEVLWRAGKDEDAMKAFDEAHAICPEDYKTLANLTRVAAHRGEWDKVVEYATETGKTAKMTDIEGLQAKALRALGRESEAKAVDAKVDAENGLADHLEEIAHEAHGHHHVEDKHERHTHDRLYALLLADEGRHLEVAQHLAGEDLQKRPDVYSWDTQAWVMFKAGKVSEAKEAMKKALALGTVDRKLTEHAKAIGL